MNMLVWYLLSSTYKSWCRHLSQGVPSIALEHTHQEVLDTSLFFYEILVRINVELKGGWPSIRAWTKKLSPAEERSLNPKKITAVKTNEFLNAKEFGNNLHTNAVIQYSGEFELIGLRQGVSSRNIILLIGGEEERRWRVRGRGRHVAWWQWGGLLSPGDRLFMTHVCMFMLE